MVVIDRSTGKVYEFWQARKINDAYWETSWGGVVDIRATGEARGDDLIARWVIGGCGAAVALTGLLCIP